MSSYKKKNLY